MYAKSPEARFRKLTIPLEEAKGGTWNNHWRGTDRPTMRYELLGITPTTGQWRWSQERSRQALANYQQMLQELEVREEGVTQQQIDEWYRQECEKRGEEIDLLRLSASGKPEHYVPPTDTKLGSDLWVDLSPRGSAELDALFGPKVFDNPKPVGLIRRMLDFITDPQGHDLVLDFFAGSCTTAQAVLELNHEDGGNRRFIMIQLPEPTGNPQFPTIADLGKERIRRVIARLKKELEGRLDLNDRETPEDLGFRAFRLAESHFRPWPDTVPPDADAYAAQMELFTDPLVEGWTVENVLYEVALKEGFGLNCRMERVESIQDHVVYRVTDPDKEQTFLICLDEEIELAALQPLHLAAEDLFIGRDRALDDETAANLALQCRLKTI
jgi:adenine-specific DNA-methyltransferase